MNLKRLIDQAVAGGLANAGFADTPAVVKQAARPEFGDYQANGVMAATKRAGRNPREVSWMSAVLFVQRCTMGDDMKCPS